MNCTSVVAVLLIRSTIYCLQKFVRYLGKIKAHIEKIMGDCQQRCRCGRAVIDNIFSLKIINEKLWEYNQSVQYLLLICKWHMTLYIETRYGNVWKNLKFLLN